METIDNREYLAELDEIYKYKNLIELSDKETIKQVIFKGDSKSKELYNEFISLVTKEVDHQLNKEEFVGVKDKLISEMSTYLSK